MYFILGIIALLICIGKDMENVAKIKKHLKECDKDLTIEWKSHDWYLAHPNAEYIWAKRDGKLGHKWENL